MQKFIPKHFLQHTSKYKVLIFDCDGVLWQGSSKIPNSFQTLNYLHNQRPQTSIFFLTNNPGHTRQKYIEQRFNHFDPTFPVNSTQILCAAYLLPAYLSFYHPQIKNVLSIGLPGMKQQLKIAGYSVSKNTFDQNKHTFSVQQFQELDVGDKNPQTKLDAICMSVDYNFSYYKLAFASLAIQRGAKFFASNPDHFMQTKNGKIPGGGSVIESVKIASGVDPIVTGKPNTFACDVIQKICAEKGEEVKKEDMLMIGDNLNTDIKFAEVCGMDSMLVLSGVTKDFKADESEIKPTYVIDRIGV